jgi:AraC-like DNA-binding protein
MHHAPALSPLAEDYRHGDQVAPHCHREGQLLYAINGVMLVTVAGADWVVPGGHALWVLPGLLHQIRMTGDVRMRTLLVEPGPHQVVPDECAVVVVSPLLRELIVTVSDISQHTLGARRNELLEELICNELAAAPRLAAHIAMPSQPRLRLLCARFIDDPGQTCGLEDWAKQMNMSSRTLARLFRKELGISVGQWRQRTRLLLSLQHLAAGASILEVALEHGYQSPSAFTAMFKRTLGYTPSQAALH